MAATTTRSRPSSNGSVASTAAEKAKEAGEAVTSVARRVKAPALATGAAAAGLVGGVALGSKLGSKRGGMGTFLKPRRRVLGVPLGHKSGLVMTAETLGKVAKGLSTAKTQATATTDDVRQIRELLDQANKRSPIEVVLDSLTHRRGAHRHEG